MSDRKYVVLTAAGADRPGLVADLSAYVAQCRGNVEDSRMSVLGGMFGIMMLVSGTTADIAAVVNGLPALADATGLTIHVHDTTPPSACAGCTRLSFELHAADREGLVHLVADYLRSVGGNIVRLDSSVYPAPVSGSPLFRLRVLVDLPDAVAGAAYDGIVELADREGMEASAMPEVVPQAPA